MGSDEDDPHEERTQRKGKTLRKRIAASLAAALLLAACGGGSSDDSKTSSGSKKDEKAVTINVFAAASLKESFGVMEKKFEATHRGVDVVFNFSGSQELVEQIDSGAPADVIATANTKTMDALKSKGKVGDTSLFTSNTLVLITPKGNPAKVTGLDSSLDKAKLVICTPKAGAGGATVPCGTATAELTKKLGVKLNPVSEEQKVTDVRSKVASGEADAGIVYRTDAVAAGKDVETIKISGADKIINNYPIGVLKDSKHASQARSFADYVKSAEGQKILKKQGFLDVQKKEGESSPAGAGGSAPAEKSSAPGGETTENK